MKQVSVTQQLKILLHLKRNQAAMATCSPSRTALLTGRHATTTHVFDLFSYFRNITGNFTTIPQHFKELGYRSFGMGKIFHAGAASGKIPPRRGPASYPCAVCHGADDGDYSWSEPYFHGSDTVDTSHKHSWVAVPENVTSAQPLQDSQTRAHAVVVLSNISRARSAGDTRRFFVAVSC